MQRGGAWMGGSERYANGYTGGMDSVRFGRVLGIGTRLAAKTVAAAVDAATAPNPSAGSNPSANRTTDASAGQPTSPVAAAGERLGEQTRRKADQAKQARQNLKQGGKRFGDAGVGPVTPAGSVLLLAATGAFLRIFAVYVR